MFDSVDMKELLHGDAGEHEEEEEQDGGDGYAEGLVGKAEAILDVIDPYGAPGPEKEPDEDETPIQRQQRLIDRRASIERRRAKAEILAETLKDFFAACDAMPHREGAHEGEG